MRLVLSASIALVLLAPACSSRSSSSSSEATRCLYRDIFTALEEVRRVQARCPTWLPDEVRPTYINANTNPEYVVEFETLGQLRYRHVVLQLAVFGDPPGQRLGEEVVGDKRAAIYFEPSPSGGPAGLHSGHFIVDVPGGAYERGSYWVSVHEKPQRSRQWNVQQALKITRSLRPVSSGEPS